MLSNPPRPLKLRGSPSVPTGRPGDEAPHVEEGEVDLTRPGPTHTTTDGLRRVGVNVPNPDWPTLTSDTPPQDIMRVAVQGPGAANTLEAGRPNNAPDDSGKWSSPEETEEKTQARAPTDTAGLEILLSAIQSVAALQQGAPSDIIAPVEFGDTENEYVVSGRTLIAGGGDITFAGAVMSALPSGSGVLFVAAGVTSTAIIGAAIGESRASSDSILSLPTPLSSGLERLVTIGGIVHTAHATEGLLWVVNGQTVGSGVTAVVNGHTVVMEGTNIIVATGTITSTHRLGDDMGEGFDGKAEIVILSATPEPTAEQATSDARKPRALLMLFVIVVFSLFLAAYLII